MPDDRSHTPSSSREGTPDQSPRFLPTRLKNALSLRADGVQVGLALVAFKVIYWCVLLLALYAWRDMDISSFGSVMQRWPSTGTPVFGSHLATWDGAHYLFLSEAGYVSKSPSCAFYPLLPALVSMFAGFTGGNHLISGLVLCNVFSLVALWLFYDYIRERLSERAGRIATVFLIVFPGALFFQFIYTESLFLLLLMWLCHTLQRRRYNWSIIPALLLPLTRPVGLFAVIPLAWHIWKNPLSAKQRMIVCAPVLGMGLYFAWMTYLTGNAMEGFDAQRYWGVNSIWNVVNFPKFLRELFNFIDFHAYKGSILDRIWFSYLLCTLPVIWKFDREWFWWAIALGVLPAMIASFVSYTRYVTMTFPLFASIDAARNFDRHKRARLWTFTLLAGCHLWLLWRHVNFRWAG